MRDYFAGLVAERYDEETADMEVEPVVDFLAELAGDGAALELGIGTGRIALPLAARGVHVQGIDLSPDMVRKLRAKPAGDEIEVALGDFATTGVEGTFSLAYVVFNTFMNLRTQANQVACFENVAAHLEPHGVFVAEIMLPELQRLSRGGRYVPFDVGRAHVGLDEYDVAEQRLISHHWYPLEGAYAVFPGRYVWPSELDLMARIAGMTLRERWSDWNRAPFTSESAKHVSVWEKS